jgi:phospholipid N-methyltransferase
MATLADPSPLSAGSSGALDFLRGFVRRPREVASLLPSSGAVAVRAAACGEAARARVIVELGPGTGVITRELLRCMSAGGKLVAIDLNPHFVELLRERLPDPRLTVVLGHALGIERALAAAGESQADLVISGLPYAGMDHPTRRRILDKTRRALRPGGRFVAYQVSGKLRPAAEPLFGAPVVEVVLRSLPPMRIFTWQRAAPSTSA